MNELWKPVVGYEGLYEINNLGDIKRLKKLYSWPIGLVRGWITNKGYRMCRLTKNKETVGVYIHNLVADTFIGNRPSGFTTNHKNGVKTDNRVENLEYLSRGDNIKHAWKIGLCKPRIGSEHPRAKVNEKDVLEMRNLRKLGTSVKAIGKQYGLCWNYIYNLTNGVRWTHI